MGLGPGVLMARHLIPALEQAQVGALLGSIRKSLHDEEASVLFACGQSTRLGLGTETNRRCSLPRVIMFNCLLWPWEVPNITSQESFLGGHQGEWSNTDFHPIAGVLHDSRRCPP